MPLVLKTTTRLYLILALAVVVVAGRADGETLLSNLETATDEADSSSFDSGNGKAVQFSVKGVQPFELHEVVLRLVLSKSSKPVLQLVPSAASTGPSRVPLNHAAGLDSPRSDLYQLNYKSRSKHDEMGPVDVQFTPKSPLLLEPGTTYRLALSTSKDQGEMRWLAGDAPSRSDGKASHLGQVYGRGDSAGWSNSSDLINLYEIRGRWSDQQPPPESTDPPPHEHYAQFSGIYPHLAMFNTADPGECGIGALVNWADRLWAVTYSPHHGMGSPDKLFEIDRDHNIYVRPESVGGTPANRMIHTESQQLLIGPYLIDRRRNVRAIPPSAMPGRLTGTARHLFDPPNKVYYASMEEAFYEVDIHTLAVKKFHGDTRWHRAEGATGFAHGNHGKGLYIGQGRVIYANNGGGGHGDTRVLNQVPEEVGSLNQWDGEKWEEIHRTGFLDVTGPGGIRGNSNPKTDPIWAIGWDYRSAILKVLDDGTWFTYRLPKASHTMDGHHGYNTEWPRIGEIGSDTERLIYLHGMFWRFPNSFASRHSAGIRPRSTYLKMVSDSTNWGDRIALACNDLSNERQAIRLNPRKIRGDLIPSISHSNLWFVEAEQLDDFGPPIGRGSVWNRDMVKAGQASDPYQCGGWHRRMLHLRHQAEHLVRFTIEFDRQGNGQWKTWETIEVPGGNYVSVSLSAAPDAEWVRLVPDGDADGVIATFHYANRDARQRPPAALFDGIARQGERQDVVGGLIRIKSTDGAPLAYVSDKGYYEMGTDMELRSVDDAGAADQLSKIARIPGPIEGPGGLTSDAASVLYIDEEDGKRYRLPRGSSEFQDVGPLGPERIDREVCRERNLFNAYGTLYELPYRNAGGFALVRPITTHNCRIKDYCTWRGLLVITGIDAITNANPRIIRSEDGKAAVWLGAVDDLWKMGKAVGIGGPWKDSPVEAGVASDPYLLTGYDSKTLSLSHTAAKSILIAVEVDITGYGDWQTYQVFNVPSGSEVQHQFPADFNAYWLRTVSDAQAIATAQLRYE